MGDYVREEKEHEEEERFFTPSAVSVPLRPLFRCDKRCREKGAGGGQRM